MTSADTEAVLEQSESRSLAADATRTRRDFEDTLIEAVKRGDQHARAQLIEEHLPRIASLSRRYAVAPHVERLELLQEGVAGLLHALERYDPARGTPFWVYAEPHVRRAMQRLVAELANAVALSEPALRRLSRLKRAEDGGVIGSLEDLVDDPRATDAYERVLDALEAQELLPLLAALSDRERMVLRAHHGLDGEPQTYGQIAERLGLSVRRVRDIERRALGKLTRVSTRPAGGLPHETGPYPAPPANT